MRSAYPLDEERVRIGEKNDGQNCRQVGRGVHHHQHLHHEETTSFIILIQEDDNY